MAALDSNGIGFIKVNAMTNSESWAYFKFRVYNKNVESDSDTIEFWFNGALSLSQNANAELTVFPNPIKSNELLTLESIHALKSVEWIAANGQSHGLILLNQDWKQNLRSPIQPGFYLLLLETEHGFVNRRIIVQ
jgi:hypothetical protein